jgi:hypothetical protein
MPLQLHDKPPLAQGRVRLVFPHPENPRWLVKVMRPDVLEARRRKSPAWLRGMRRLGPYAQFSREIDEYLAAHSCARECLPFLQKVIGLAETDMGLGLVVEAACGRDGKPGLTIDGLRVGNLFDETAQRALVVFLDCLLASRVVVSDLHWRNLVYAHSAEQGDHFVMIDGLGSSNPLPLKEWFPVINRRSKLHRIRRLKHKLAQSFPAAELIRELRP